MLFFVFLKTIISIKFFICLHGDKNYNSFVCGNTKTHIISTDEDPGLRIESFAVINLRGVSANKTIIIISVVN
jgi:hypothetical protein